MENDHNLNMSEDGGDGIELLDTETVQVHVDAPNGGACAAMGATAKATTTAATLPTPTAQMPPMQMMQPGAPLDSNTIMMMFQQMQMQQAQAQAQMQQQMQMFQESILAMKTPAPAPAKEPTLRLGKPPKFDLEKESITFNTWREKWTYYVKSSGIMGLTGTRRAETMRAELQLALSDATIRWLSHQNITAAQKEDTDFIIERLQEHIKGNTNPLVSVVNTFKFKQREDDDPEFYFSGLEERSKYCGIRDIKDPEDWWKVTNTVINIYSEEVRVKLLLEKDLTYQRAKEIVIAEWKAARTAKQMAGGGSVNPSAAAVSAYKNSANAANQNRQPRQQDGQNRGRSQSRGRRGDGKRPPSNHPQCGRCGKNNHKAEDCYAKNKTCEKCQKIGHYANMCKSGHHRANRLEECDEPVLKSVQIWNTTSAVQPLDLIKVKFTGAVGKSIQVGALPDTGANVTAISNETFQQTGNVLNSKQAAKPKTADGTKMRTIGTAKFSVEFKDMVVSTEVYVIEGLESPILSRNLLKKFRLIPEDFPHVQIAAVSESPKTFNTGNGPELDNLLNKYSVLFDGKCKVMKNGLYHIDLDPEAVPINTGASRMIAEPYMPALKQEIESLKAQGIIEEVEGATPWLHPIVVVPKKNTTDIRMCVDLTKLNRYVQRPVNPQLTPWEVIRNIPKGTKHYAVFDALKGYHQIDLDEESRALTTFMTPFGRYRYCRLPFGLSSAGDVFTLKYGNAVDEAVDGRRATEDTLLRGATLQDLVENTEEFFKSCLENNITLNLKKIQWNKKEVLFGGYLLTPQGYQIDPALNKALAEFPVPKSQTDVRSFCGLANQTCNFSDEISELLSPFKSLLKKGTKFDWLPEFQTAFEKARTHLSSTKALAFYDVTKPTRLIADASRLFGLGFVLKQEVEPTVWRTVQAGSRFLSPAETRYAMVELELLAICWATNKCKMFIEGLPRAQFEIWTDHAPLVPILDKFSLPEIENKRLQRLKMKLEHLTFRTKWIKGEDNVEADCLSRNPCTKAKASDELDELDNIHTANIAVCNMEDLAVINEVTIPIRDQRLQEVIKAASNDPDYASLKSLIERGFPNQKAEMEDKLAPFWQYRDDLYIDSDEFIVYKDRLFIPKELRRTYLLRLLSMHQAADKMMARARKSLWWPFITRDVQNVALTCKPCQEYKPSNRDEPLRPHEPATYPFQFVHMDLGEVNGKYFLISADQYSGFTHIFECGKTAKTAQVIEHTVSLFENFSVPITIYSDGGPQFKENGEFDDFCEKWGIQHINSSPYMSRSNGVAEEAVKEMKKIIRANVSQAGVLDRQSTVAGLMMFRNTPRSPTNLSPAQIIFGQDVRDCLPMNRTNLRPDNRFAVEQRLQEVREKRKEKENDTKGKREMELLRPGQKVFVQHPATKRWTRTATVVNFGKNNREYIIRDDETERVLRRNRKFLKIQKVEPVAPPKQPVPVPKQYSEMNQVPSEPSVSEAIPEAKNIRPKRLRKPIVRFVPNLNKYHEYESESEV